MPTYLVAITAGEKELLLARIEAKDKKHAKAQALETMKMQRGHAKKLVPADIVVTAVRSDIPEWILKCGAPPH